MNECQHLRQWDRKYSLEIQLFSRLIFCFSIFIHNSKMTEI